jgi:hypothetical protein
MTKAIKAEKPNTRMVKALSNILEWQIAHEKEDATRFKEIGDAIAKLPDTNAVAKAVADSVKVTVNGKIDAVKTHLDQQDVALEALSKKIRPLDSAKTWLQEAARVVMYVGGIAISIAGIIELLKMMGIIK